MQRIDGNSGTMMSSRDFINSISLEDCRNRDLLLCMGSGHMVIISSTSLNPKWRRASAIFFSQPLMFLHRFVYTLATAAHKQLWTKVKAKIYSNNRENR